MSLMSLLLYEDYYKKDAQVQSHQEFTIKPFCPMWEGDTFQLVLRFLSLFEQLPKCYLFMFMHCLPHSNRVSLLLQESSVTSLLSVLIVVSVKFVLYWMTKFQSLCLKKTHTYRKVSKRCNIKKLEKRENNSQFFFNVRNIYNFIKNQKIKIDRQICNE